MAISTNARPVRSDYKSEYKCSDEENSGNAPENHNQPKTSGRRSGSGWWRSSARDQAFWCVLPAAILLYFEGQFEGLMFGCDHIKSAHDQGAKREQGVSFLPEPYVGIFQEISYRITLYSLRTYVLTAAVRKVYRQKGRCRRPGRPGRPPVAGSRFSSIVAVVWRRMKVRLDAKRQGSGNVR